MLYSIIFSPTGGTKKVADILCNTFEMEKKEIDLCDATNDFHYAFQKDDVCLIAIPSFGGRVPTIVIERLQQMQGNGSKAILVVVYGNRAYEDTLIELKNTVDAIGFHSIGAISAIAQHSIMQGFGQHRPDDKDVKELQSFARELQNVMHHEHILPLCVPGNEPYKEYHGVPLKPSADKHCNHCGICAQSCPVQAIDLQNPSTTNQDQCISCMRCIAICPQQARKVNKLLLLGATKALKKACATRKENSLYIGE